MHAHNSTVSPKRPALFLPSPDSKSHTSLSKPRRLYANSPLSPAPPPARSPSAPSPSYQDPSRIARRCTGEFCAGWESWGEGRLWKFVWLRIQLERRVFVRGFLRCLFGDCPLRLEVFRFVRWSMHGDCCCCWFGHFGIWWWCCHRRGSSWLMWGH
jgi:hypothetical protein